MIGSRKMAGALAGSSVVLAVAVAALAGTTFGETIRVGNLILTADGDFKPKRLSVSKFTPISVRGEGQLATDDGSRPPIVDGGMADFDRAGTLNTKGIPTCKAARLQNTLTQTALKRCGDALVGRGWAEAVVDYEDQGLIPVKGPLLGFNGVKRRGNPTVVFHVFAEEPLSTAYVAEGVITKSPVRGMGKRLTIKRIPAIAGGNGTLTEVRGRVARQIKVRKGGRTRKVDYLLAKCTDGDLVVDIELNLRTGEKLDLSIVRPCKRKR